MTTTATLTGAGWTMPADSSYSGNLMTGGGRIAPAGARFVAAKVTAIAGGASPQIQIRNGMSDAAPLVRSVAATVGAAIDQRSAPDLCADGMWLTVTGSPISIQVECLWK